MTTIFFPCGWSQTDCHFYFRGRGWSQFYVATLTGSRREGYCFTFPA